MFASSFDFTSWYATVVYIVGGVLALVSALEKLYGWSRWLGSRRSLRATTSQPRRPPVIVVGGVSYSYSTTTINERTLTQRAFLTRLEANYAIENKEAAVTVTDVTTGVRRKEGGGQHASDFRFVAMAPRDRELVRLEVPFELFDGLTDRDYEDAFLFWVRFTAPEGWRCETRLDPASGAQSRLEVLAED
jgi:hypothetical protein